MAYLIPSPLVKALRGKIGNLYIAEYGGQLLLKRRPQRKEQPPTPAQVPSRRNLIDANAYWAMVREDPELKAVYMLAAAVRGKRAYDLARADFMNPPEIHDIDLTRDIGRVGDPVFIRAEDDFEVARVELRVLTLEGGLIEEGTAAFDPESGRWVYARTKLVAPGQPVVMEVTALDRPGHRVTKRVDHVCGLRTT